MKGYFIDHLFYGKAKAKYLTDGHFFLDTDHGRIRVFDSGGSRPVLINVPDGPNVIEHHSGLLASLSKDFRVICFEYPGLGLSYPNARFNYGLDHGAALLFQVMAALEIETASLLFSCSNGFYALHAAQQDKDRFRHIFLAQTPGMTSMWEWTKTAIPPILKKPVIGQTMNAVLRKKLAHTWYQYALPKQSEHREPFRKTAMERLEHGGCFCLSSLVHGLRSEVQKTLDVQHQKVTLVWGNRDFSHRKTEKASILEHVPACEIVEFEGCGHFPELERTSEFVQLVRERVAH